MDCSLNSEGLDTPCGLSYLFCPSRGQGRPLFLPYSLSLSLNLLSILFPNPLFILSLSPSLSHPFPHSVLHPASGVASGAADSGGGEQWAALVYHSPKPPICRRGSHEDILYELIINTIRKPDAWSGHGWSRGKRKSTRIH